MFIRGSTVYKVCWNFQVSPLVQWALVLVQELQVPIEQVRLKGYVCQGSRPASVYQVQNSKHAEFAIQSTGDRSLLAVSERCLVDCSDGHHLGRYQEDRSCGMMIICGSVDLESTGSQI